MGSTREGTLCLPLVGKPAKIVALSFGCSTDFKGTKGPVFLGILVSVGLVWWGLGC